MRKYWVFFLQTISEFLTYRLRFFFTTFFQFVTPLTMIWVFTALPGNKFAGMTKEQLISYYISTSFLYTFMNSKVDDFVKIAIQQGDLGRYLIKPINFWVISLISDLSRRLTRWVFCLPLFAVIFIFGNISFGTLIKDFSPVVFPVLAISLSLTFVFSFSLGLLTFWLEELWGWQNLKEISIVLLSGIALPYQFFPQSLVNFLKLTPFPYFVAWPLRIGFTGNIFFEFFIAGSWTFIFLFTSIFLWKRGLKIYSGMGLY